MNVWRVAMMEIARGTKNAAQVAVKPATVAPPNTVQTDLEFAFKMCVKPAATMCPAWAANVATKSVKPRPNVAAQKIALRRKLAYKAPAKPALNL